LELVPSAGIHLRDKHSLVLPSRKGIRATTEHKEAISEGLKRYWSSAANYRGRSGAEALGRRLAAEAGLTDLDTTTKGGV
jgi:hypothetical protein